MEGAPASTASSRLSATGEAAPVRARELIGRVPLALWAVLGVGIALRLVIELAYRPAILAFADAAPYLSMADHQLFSDPARPMGYSLVLRAAHLISADIDFTIVLQHALGVATALLLYAAVRRLGGPVWVAVVAAAAVLLPIDQIGLEHMVASEGPFTFLFTGFLYAAVRALEPGRELVGPLESRHLWLAVAGLLLALSGWVRTIAVPLIPFFALWALLAAGGGWRRRLAAASVALVPAVVVMLTYFAWHDSVAGTFGLNRMGGWTVYSRVAQFADCSRFTPPPGTERLCEEQPSIERPGPDFYTWIPGSPGRKLFGYPPAGEERLGEWGWEALKAQPVDYLDAVANDLIRYFFPTFNDFRPYGGVGYELIDIDRRDPPIEDDIRTTYLNPYYDDEASIEVSDSVLWLADIQQIVRVHPVLMLEALLLGLAGIWYGSGRIRMGLVLLSGASLLILAVAASSTYNARYAIPVNGPLIAAGVLGLWVLFRVRTERSQRAAGSPTA